MNRAGDIIWGVAIGFAAAVLILSRPEPKPVRVLLPTWN